MDTNHRFYNSTIREPLSFTGKGMHTGGIVNVTLLPSYENQGVYFVRNDVDPARNIIYTSFQNVSDSKHSTYLSNQYGVAVFTIEYLLAALSVCRIDNVRIEIDSAEVPLTAGGAKDFVTAIHRVGVAYLHTSKQAIWINEPIAVRHGTKGAILIPNPVPRVTVRVDYPTSIKSLYYTVSLLGDQFFYDIVFARTFKHVNQIEDRRHQGLKSDSSLIKAALGGSQGLGTSDLMRRHNELVRRKILAAIGDLSLAGKPIMGHYLAYKANHNLNRKLLKKMFRDKHAWTNMAIETGEQKFAERNKIYSQNYMQKSLNSIKKLSAISNRV